MSFGYSVGDFVTGYNVTYQLVRILAESRGASIEYQEAMTELRAMEQVFLKAGSLVSSKILSRDITNGIACIVLSAVDIIDNFYERSKEYQDQLGRRKAMNSKTTVNLESSWCKIGWTLFKKEELRTLKTQLHERLTSVNVLLGMASYQSNLPPEVAQYEERPKEGIPEISVSTTAETRVQNWREDQSRYTGSTLATSSSYPQIVLRPVSPISETSQTQQSVGEQSGLSRLDTSTFMQPKTPDSIGSDNSSTKMRTKVESVGAIEHNATHAVNGDVPVDDKAGDPLPATQLSASSLEQMIHEIREKAERETRAKIEAERITAAAAIQEAEDKERLRTVLESLETKLAAITARETRKELAEAKAKEVKAPLRFKDAVGRKFNFPFHICKTWQGVEELIKQAFLHVDVIGPHVQAGHYDLMGPDGEIILPQVWEKVIEPDWAITMHMWPMDRMSADPLARPGKPPGARIPGGPMPGPPPGRMPGPPSGSMPAMRPGQPQAQQEPRTGQKHRTSHGSQQHLGHRELRGENPNTGVIDPRIESQLNGSPDSFVTCSNSSWTNTE